MTGTSETVTCVDSSDKMLSVLKKRMKAAGLTNIKPMEINTPTDLPEGSFDFILLIDILHLLKYKVAMVDTLTTRLSVNWRLLIKFEYFTNSQIKSIMDGFDCRLKKQIMEKYWLIGESVLNNEI